jgi:mycoredoxin
MTESEGSITLYISTYCGSARSVERLLREHGVAMEVINIDDDPEARRRLIELNGGYASVPTLILADGRRLTEPSLATVRQTLGIAEPEVGQRVRRFFGGRR